MKYLKSFESFIHKPKIIRGDEVWGSAVNAGSEHNDGLEYCESVIRSKNYYLLNIPINQILECDPDVKYFVENEIIPYTKDGEEFSKKRKIKQPIIIGEVNRGGPDTFYNGVVDGSNRVAQATVNGQKEIMAYVPIDSIFVKNLKYFESIQYEDNYRFEEDYYDYNNQQHYVRMMMYYNDELVAKSDYVVFKNKIYISFIESLVKGKGYGQELMKYLAKLYGYENLERSGQTPDGEKMRKSLDKHFNFNYDEYQKSKNKHLDKKVLIDIKNPIIKEFLIYMINVGYEKTWEIWRNTDDFKKIRNEYDLNDVSEISNWIKGSKTNDNDPLEEVPDYIQKLLQSLYDQ